MNKQSPKGGILSTHTSAVSQDPQTGLKSRLRLENLILSISTRFINVKPNDIPSEVSWALSEVGRFAGVDRAYIFEYHHRDKTMSCTYEWCAKGITSYKNEHQNLNRRQFSWLVNRIQKGLLHISGPGTMPPKGSLAWQALNKSKVKSLIALPMVSNYKKLGFMGLSTVNGTRDWPQDLIALLKTLSGIFANTIDRRAAAAALEWELSINGAIAELSESLIRPEITIEEISNNILRYAQSLTGCDHGFVSAIDHTTGDNVGQTLTQMMESCPVKNSSDKKIHLPIGANKKYGKLWGHALNTKKPFYTNDPGSHESSGGIPQGHVPLKNYLAVPALLGGRLMGLIALANSPTGFRDMDQNAVSQLAHLYALALLRVEFEQDMLESEEKYRSLLDNIPGAIARVDSQGNFLFINKFFQALTGYQPEAIIGKGPEAIKSFFTKDSYQDMLASITRVLKNKEMEEVELWARDSHGKDRYLLHRAYPWSRPDGSFGGAEILTFDITKRKSAERDLETACSLAQQKSEESDALLRSTRAVIEEDDFKSAARRIFDIGREITGAASGYIALLSEDGEENEVLFLEAGGTPRTVNPELPMPIRGLRAQAYTTGKCVYENNFMKSKWVKFMPKGHARLTNVLFAPLIISGKVIGIMGLANKPADFNARDSHMAGALAEMAAISLKNTRTRETLRENEQRTTALLNASPDLMFRINNEGTITDIHVHKNAKLFRSRKSLIGSSIKQLPISAEKQAQIQDAINKSIATREVQVVEYAMTIKGRELVYEARICHSGNNEVVSFIRDITESRKSEEELQKSQKLESVGQLAGGIAHDFNNLLAGILGNIDLARKLASQPDKVKLYLNNALKSFNRAQELTQRLLTFSRGGVPVIEDVSLKTVVEQSIELALSGSNIRCNCLFPGLRLVKGDGAQLTQVFNNIFLNSLQAMPQGGVIRVIAKDINLKKSIKVGLEPGNYIQVKVEDEGTGIPENIIPKIFDPFFSTRDIGRGLGLSAAYSIIKKHQGQIEAGNSPGKGARITIWLPASNTPSNVKKPVSHTTTSNDIHILVMDDEEMILILAAEMIGALGYKVDTVESGEKAVSAYRQSIKSKKKYDAVILDLTIPGGIDGKETLARILKLDPEARVIISSGYSNNPVVSDPHSFGFKDVLPKPYRIADMTRVLGAVLKE